MGLVVKPMKRKTYERVSTQHMTQHSQTVFLYTTKKEEVVDFIGLAIRKRQWRLNLDHKLNCRIDCNHRPNLGI